jgi:hypothetical protein
MATSRVRDSYGCSSENFGDLPEILKIQPARVKPFAGTFFQKTCKPYRK